MRTAGSFKYLLVLSVLSLNACMTGRNTGGDTGATRLPNMPSLPISADNDIQAIMGTGGSSEVSNPRSLSGLTPTTLRLPGAMVNRRGSVNAVIFPMSYGLRRSAWKEQQIAYQIFGVATDSIERADGSAARLADASLGVFRLNASMVMPLLVDPDGTEAQIAKAFQSAAGLAELANRLMTPWLSRVNLASYDNDGPDGLPSSGDDDGMVDLPIVLVETDNLSASAVVSINNVVSTGPRRAFKVRIGSVLMVALPRNTGNDPDNLEPTLALSRALGVKGDPIFTIGHPAGELSVESRLQLGWVEAVSLTRSGSYNLAEGVVYIVPVLDVPGGMAKWLVESASNKTYATRVVKRQDGRWVRTEQKIISQGQTFSLPLTGLGEAGRIARIGWQGSQALIAFDLSAGR